MAVFISHSKKDSESPEFISLIHDLERMKFSVWVDKSLEGGEPWWKEILDQIRRCDVFLVVLSMASLKSEACRAELRYALATNRSVLPVKLIDLPEWELPESLARLQILSYSNRGGSSEEGIESVLGLRSALDRILAKEPPALPDPLPPDPEVPLTYLLKLNSILETVDLPLSQQDSFLKEVKAHVDALDPEDQRSVMEILTRFRKRPDIALIISLEVDRLLSDLSARPQLEPVTPDATKNQHADHVGSSSDRSSESTADLIFGVEVDDGLLIERDPTADEGSPRLGENKWKLSHLQAPGLNLSKLVETLEGWYESQKLDVQKWSEGTQVIVQCRSKAWARRTGVGISLTVILWMDGDDLVVQIGATKWVDKVATAGAASLAGAGLLTVGAGLLGPVALIPAIPMAFGSSRRMTAPGKILRYIESIIPECVEDGAGSS
jgi:hypothetical protein